VQIDPAEQGFRAGERQPTRFEFTGAERHVTEPSPGGLRRSAKRRVCLIGLNNLAVLAPQYDKSGAAGEPVQHTLLARALIKRGYDVSMISADHGQRNGELCEGIRLFAAYPLGAGLPMLRFFHPRWTGLWDAMRRADADVYYVSCAGAIVGQVGLYCRLHKKPYVFRVASDADCAPDTLVLKKWRWRDGRLYAYGLRHANAVLAQSEHQRKLLQKNYAVAGTIASLLVDTPQQSGGFADRDIDVLWVNNLRELKRPDIFLRLADALPNLRFHVVGGPVPGDQAFYEATKAQMQQRANLTFHGPVQYESVNSFYSRARVLVNVSDIEGFPNSYLQAWSRGTPVAAYFDPDNMIARNRLGVAAKSYEELCEAVATLAAQERAWEEASARCQRFMAARFGADTILRPYLEALDAGAGRQVRV
jgi:glycosyltransferase involved in cell wall biosynthesis